MPPPTIAQPIFAGHYFGDFQLSIAYSQLSDPYNPTFIFGGGLPITFYLFKIFNLLPLTYSFILFLIVGMGLLIYSNFCLFRNCQSSYVRFFMALVISVLNLPILIALDRGNFIIFALAIMMFSLYLGVINQSSQARYYVHLGALLFMVSASIKIYLVCLLIPLWFCKAKFFAFLSLTYFLAFNILGALFIKFDLVYMYESVKSSLLYQTGNSDIGWLMSGVGFPSFGSNLYSAFSDIEKSTVWLDSLGFKVFSLNILWFLIICLLSTRKELAIEIKLIWILSLIQFAPPVAMAYNLIWCISGMGLLFRFLNHPKSPDGVNLISAKLLLLPLFVSLIPIPSVYWRLVSPFIWIFTLLVQLFCIRRYSKRSN
jgi:hypothetical protein